MTWTSNFGVAMKGFVYFAAFFGGMASSVTSGKERQRGSETVLEDHWIREQVRKPHFCFVHVLRRNVLPPLPFP